MRRWMVPIEDRDLRKLECHGLCAKKGKRSGDPGYLHTKHDDTKKKPRNPLVKSVENSMQAYGMTTK
jgi:hypothetical protein